MTGQRSAKPHTAQHTYGPVQIGRTQRTSARAYLQGACAVRSNFQIQLFPECGTTCAAILLPVQKLVSLADSYNSGAMVSECGVGSACQDLNDQVHTLLVSKPLVTFTGLHCPTFRYMVCVQEALVSNNFTSTNSSLLRRLFNCSTSATGPEIVCAEDLQAACEIFSQLCMFLNDTGSKANVASRDSGAECAVVCMLASANAPLCIRHSTPGCHAVGRLSPGACVHANAAEKLSAH